MSTETPNWLHLERADARLIRRALVHRMSGLLDMGPGGRTLDPHGRGLGDFVSELEGIAALLSCTNGCDAPGFATHLPEYEDDRLVQMTLEDYAADCDHVSDHYRDDGDEGAATFYESDALAARALAERIAA